MLNKLQRLSREGVGPSGSKWWTPFNTGEDIVWSSGKPEAAGKAAGIRVTNYPEHKTKRLPFPNKFDKHTITDPLQVYEAFDYAETQPHIHTIVVDSATFLMDMFESVYVVNSTNTMKAWGDYNQFFKNLMQDKVAKSTKRVIFTAHTLSQLNESEMVVETKIPVKGALKNQGLESYFSCIVYAKKMTLKQLKDYKNDLLVITPEEEILGYKHVFQTCITKDTVHDRIRSPRFMWKMNESFIDNDVSKLLQRIHEFYEE